MSRDPRVAALAALIPSGLTAFDAAIERIEGVGMVVAETERQLRTDRAHLAAVIEASNGPVDDERSAGIRYLKSLAAGHVTSVALGGRPQLDAIGRALLDAATAIERGQHRTEPESQHG